MNRLNKKLTFGIGLAALNIVAVTLPLSAQADTVTSTTDVGLTVNPVITS